MKILRIYKKQVALIISKFNRVSGYEVTVQKSAVLLYTCNEQSNNEIKKAIPFITLCKKIKYLSISLTREVKDLDTENYKTDERKLKKT